MSQTLRLEYACTDAELEQARSLHLRKQLGGGSRWRTNALLFAMLVAMLVGGWFRFREVPAGYRALLLASIVGGSVLYVLLKRLRRKADPRMTRLEVSETGVAILGDGSRVVLPWSAFGECLESPDLFVLLDRPKQTLVVVPKRAFPNEDSHAWFRQQATLAPSLATTAPGDSPAPVSSGPADRVALTVQPRYRDYLACTVASWRTRGVCLAVGGMLVGVTLYSAANPPPDAVNSSATFFVLLGVPFFLAWVALIVGLFSIRAWRSNARYAGPQEVAFSEQSVEFSGADGSGTLPWTSFAHYQETPWHFLLWRGSRWMMLPKRAFASPNDVDRCRELLDRRLTHSRWFIG